MSHLNVPQDHLLVGPDRDKARRVWRPCHRQDHVRMLPEGCLFPRLLTNKLVHSNVLINRTQTKVFAARAVGYLGSTARVGAEKPSVWCQQPLNDVLPLLQLQGVPPLVFRFCLGRLKPRPVSGMHCHVTKKHDLACRPKGQKRQKPDNQPTNQTTNLSKRQTTNPSM